MSEPTADTAFLADNEHDGEENHFIKRLPANAHFKRPLKIITALDSVLSILVFALLIVSLVMIRTGPFGYTYGSDDAVRDLAIALFINFILAAPTIVLTFPIWLNLASQFALSIVVLVFSGQIFGHGWPNAGFCHRWSGPPDYQTLPELDECKRARDIILINMAVCGGVGLLVGLLLLTTLLLRVIAVARTRFWQRQSLGFLKWNPAGFTVQFTLSVLPHDSKRVAVVDNVGSSAQEGRLVET